MNPETKPIQIQPVLNKLRTIGPEVFQEKLDAEPIDSKVGFAHVSLPEIESVVAEDGQVYNFHAAKLPVGVRVLSHVHSRGDEPYRVVEGEEGVMHIGTIVDTIDGQTVRRSSDIRVRRGGEIIVRADEAHSFKNTGSTPLYFTFACPDSHLDDTQDRVMTADLPEWLPSI